jgi:antitoxin (DNA-binding transcriptional repressor) of toxin-antitoxin stability system
MKTLEVAQATASLAEYARDVKAEPVILTVDGKPVAALVAIENADAETTALSTNPEFLALIERSRTHQASKGGISGTEMRRRLGLKSTSAARTR